MAGRGGMTAAAVDEAVQPAAAEPETAPQRCKICTIVTATSVREAVRECAEAATSGADIVELRLDFLDYLNPQVGSVLCALHLALIEILQRLPQPFDDLDAKPALACQCLWCLVAQRQAC